ncbi:MAG: 4-hydroxy-tetrahydrodipicolinate reductase, partial [Pseudomonadota bacterium]
MNVGVVGAAGRMGRRLCAAVDRSAEAVLIGAALSPGDARVGADVAELIGGAPRGVALGDDAVLLFRDAEAVLDFTTPDACVAFSALAAQSPCVHVIGVTGLDADQDAAIDRAALHTPIVHAPNMSLGVNLLLALVKQAAAALPADYDAEVFEIHHRRKADAPSGTALALGRAVAAGRGQDFDAAAVRAREGITGPRGAGEIGFATARGGGVIGDHTVYLAADGERIELTHRAADRDIYADGALRAALWAKGRSPGRYGMRDV